VVGPFSFGILTNVACMHCSVTNLVIEKLLLVLDFAYVHSWLGYTKQLQIFTYDKVYIDSSSMLFIFINEEWLFDILWNVVNPICKERRHRWSDQTYSDKMILFHFWDNINYYNCWDLTLYSIHFEAGRWQRPRRRWQKQKTLIFGETCAAFSTLIWFKLYLG
jgi:hypothetical protein